MLNIKLFLDRFFPTSRRLLVKESLKSIKLTQYRDVLVVGAGADPYKKMFTSQGRYICTDISCHHGKTDICADAHKLPIGDSCFDCVICSEVLEHLHNPYVFVQEAYRVLRPRGRLVMTVPFMYHQHADPFDYWRPTSQAIEVLCEDFATVQIMRQGNRLHVISDLISTSFYPFPVLYPLRIINWALVYLWIDGPKKASSSACSGHLLVAKK